MRNVSKKVVVKTKAHILRYITFLSNRAGYKIIRKIMAQLDRPHDNGARSLRAG
jgi:Flp pilus assembly CpaF family ATPase